MKITAQVDYGNCTETLKIFDNEESYAAELEELEIICQRLGGTLIESVQY